MTSEPDPNPFQASLTEATLEINQFIQEPPSNLGRPSRELSRELGRLLRQRLIATIEVAIQRQLHDRYNKVFPKWRSNPAKPNWYRWGFTDRFEQFPEKVISDWTWAQLTECNEALENNWVFVVDVKGERADERSSVSISGHPGRPMRKSSGKERGRDPDEEYGTDESPHGMALRGRTGQRRSKRVSSHRLDDSSDDYGRNSQAFSDVVLGTPQPGASPSSNERPLSQPDEDEDKHHDHPENLPAGLKTLINSITPTLTTAWNKLQRQIDAQAAELEELRAENQMQTEQIHQLKQEKDQLKLENEKKTSSSTGLRAALECLATDLGKYKSVNEELTKKNVEKDILLEKAKEEARVALQARTPAASSVGTAAPRIRDRDRGSTSVGTPTLEKTPVLGEKRAFHAVMDHVEVKQEPETGNGKRIRRASNELYRDGPSTFRNPDHDRRATMAGSRKGLDASSPSPV